MQRRILLALGASLGVAVFAGCEDVPGLPRWDADWLLPLPSQTISFQSEWGAPTVPPNATFAVDFPPQNQSTTEALGAVVGETLRELRVILELRKPLSTAIGTIDTLFIGSAPGALSAGNPNTIVLPLALAVGDSLTVDTVVVTATNRQMIQTVADQEGDLWIQLRGRAQAGPAGHTFSASDNLGVRVQLVARVAMSR
jgi:hypothetical protein